MYAYWLIKIICTGDYIIFPSDEFIRRDEIAIFEYYVYYRNTVFFEEYLRYLSVEYQ